MLYPSRLPHPSNQGKLKSSEFCILLNLELQMNCTLRRELPTREGDIIYITDMNDTRWWKGTCKGKTRPILSNYAAQQGGFIDNTFYETSKRDNLSWLRVLWTITWVWTAWLCPNHWKHHPFLGLTCGLQRYSGGAVYSAKRWAEPAKQTSWESQLCISCLEGLCRSCPLAVGKRFQDRLKKHW